MLNISFMSLAALLNAQYINSKFMHSGSFGNTWEKFLSMKFFESKFKSHHPDGKFLAPVGTTLVEALLPNRPFCIK